MEDKVFELMTKIFSEITDKLEKIDKKLDSKADKMDIVHMRNNTGQRCICMLTY